MENENETKNTSPMPIYVNDRLRLFDNVRGVKRVVITCIYGPFRCGKSTLVQNLVKAFNTPVILDEDKLRSDVFNREFADINCNEMVARMAYYFATMGNDVIVDAITADKTYDILRNYITTVNSHKARIINKLDSDKSVDIVLRKVAVDEVTTFAQ